MKKNCKVVAIGNTILSDNRITFLVFEKLKSMIKNVEIEMSFISTAGITLLEAMEGFSHLIVIDTVKTGKVLPGEVIVFDPESFDLSPNGKIVSGLRMNEILLLGNKMGFKIPEKVKILGIEIEEDKLISEVVSEKLTESVDPICFRIIETLKGMDFNCF